jgi:hypothetical protein
VQILSVVCDNALCNDHMIEVLDQDVGNFFQVNRIRCFLHVVNLVAKSLLKEFDISKAKGADGVDDECEHQLQELADDFELEELLAQAEVDRDDGEDDDDVEGFVSARDVLNGNEIALFEANVHPVQLVLAKVSSKRLNDLPE